jgi:hypothetical protein
VIVADGARGSISGRNDHEAVDIQEDRVVDHENHPGQAARAGGEKEKGSKKSSGGGLMSKVSGFLGENALIALVALVVVLLMAIRYTRTQTWFRNHAAEDTPTAGAPATPQTSRHNPNEPITPVTPIPGGGSML